VKTCSKITFTIQTCRTCPIHETITLCFSAKQISFPDVYVEKVHNYCSNRITKIITSRRIYTYILYICSWRNWIAGKNCYITIELLRTIWTTRIKLFFQHVRPSHISENKNTLKQVYFFQSKTFPSSELIKLNSSILEVKPVIFIM